jgi:hypothetical protein
MCLKLLFEKVLSLVSDALYRTQEDLLNGAILTFSVYK